GGALSARNRVAARISRAAAAVGAKEPARALGDLDYVDERLRDSKVVASLQWPHDTAEHVARKYRLIAGGLRATANRGLQRFDAEADALRGRRAILDEELKESGRIEIARAAMLTEAQLAVNAQRRSDVAGVREWLGKALVRADDVRARESG